MPDKSCREEDKFAAYKYLQQWGERIKYRGLELTIVVGVSSIVVKIPYCRNL